MNRKTPGAFSLIEVVVATAIVSVMISVALTSTTAIQTRQAHHRDQMIGQWLGEDLMQDILHLKFEAYPGSSIGPSPSEANNGTRGIFNDLDDYHGWDASPPEYHNGTAMDDYTIYRRSVHVHWTDPNDLSRNLNYDTRVKRIDLTVWRNDTPIAEMTCVRSASWPGYEK